MGIVRLPSRTTVLAAIILVVAALIFVPAAAGQEAAPPERDVAPFGTDADPAVVPYADVISAAEANGLNAAVVDRAAGWVVAADDAGRLVAAQIPDPQQGQDFGATGGQAPGDGLPGAFELDERLEREGVTLVSPAPVASTGGESSSLIRSLIFPITLIVVAVLIIGAFFLMRGRGAGRGGARGAANAHGKMRKNALVTPPDVRFSDVAGCDEAVEELQEVVMFLREPWRFAKVGARMPRGVILHGPPGTGKTLIAKAVAGESGVPFFAVAGSEFVETFVGVGAARVRDLFAEARKSKSGAIIFFDEIDAIGRARSSGPGSGADSEREGTLNQLLVELDGFGERERIVVVAATNRVDMLDVALLRAGRFDRRVQVSAPSEAGRLEIMRLHSKGMPIENEDDLARVATVTAGFAGSDLSNLLNEAAIMAARDGRDQITAADLDEGMLRALAGPQKRDGGVAGDELEAIAWHEAGHCLAAELCPTHAKTQRVTILARGSAGGLALYGNTDRALTSRRMLHEQMVVVMAGRAAEHVGVGTISSGAANDLERANEMARAAVERLGFSDVVGQIVSASGPNAMPLSSDTRTTIDREVARLVATAYSDAVTLLSDHKEPLRRLVFTLKEREQLDRGEIDEVLADGIAEEAAVERPPSEPEPLPVPPPAPSAAPEAAPLEEPSWSPEPLWPNPVPEPSLAAVVRALWRQRRRARRAHVLPLRLRRPRSQAPPTGDAGR